MTGTGSPRLAYLLGQYPRATDTFIQREIAALRAQGARVEVLAVRRPAPAESGGEELRAERERTFYVVPAGALGLLAAHASLLAARPAAYLRALRLALRTARPGARGLLYQLFYFAEAGIVARRLSALGLAHVHNHGGDASGTVAMLTAALAGGSFSLTVHGPSIFFEPEAWRLDEKLRRALFVACISHYCRSQCMIWAPPGRWDRLHVVHCGVDVQEFARREHRGPGSRLLFVGRLAAVKGLAVLIDALAHLRAKHAELELTIVGDGPERAALEARVRSAGVADHVRFTGYRSQAEVREHLERSDLFVLPSFAEGVPVVLMEAMAAGVPVVATNVAGVSELVEDGVNGILVRPGDAEVLARRIALLLDDPNLRARLGRAGREKVAREFDQAAESAWLRRVMEAALDGRVEPVRPAERHA
jgi:glycosyltransferase involved in cell wall biosynthesis